MSSEVNKIRAKFESNQADADTTPKKVQQTSKVKGKKPPPPARNPQLTSKAIRDKLNATIAQDSHSSHKPSPPPKRYPDNSKKEAIEKLSSSPGLSALASVLQHSPKSPHGSSNGLHKAPNLSPPLKSRNKQASPVLRATGKALSADLSKPRSSSDVLRTYSSVDGATERGGVTADDGDNNSLSPNNATKHVVQGDNKSTSPLSNSCGHLHSVEEGNGSTVKHDTLSENWLEKSASLPRSPNTKVERSKPSSSSVKVKVYI